MNGWDDPGNAGLYDEFARKQSLYRDTCRDLIELARIKHAGVTVDLGCGTGVSTEAILGSMEGAGRVVGIDASASMLEVARLRLADERVRWVKADATEIAAYVSGVDAIICNAAIWQMEMEKTIGACGNALRSGGRFAFNIHGHSEVMRFVPESRRPAKPTLVHLIQALAVLEYDFIPPRPTVTRGTRRSKRALTPETVTDMIGNAGLIVDLIKETEYDHPAESQLEWLKVPVFAENILPGMPYKQQIRIINAAFERFDKDSAQKKPWFVFVAHKP